MSNSSEVQDALQGRRQEAARIEAQAVEAARLEKELTDQRKDLQRFEKRRDAFAALGNRHVELPYTANIAGFGTVAMQPALSVLTGAELAAGVQVNIDSLKAAIAAREDAIQDLLAP